jgi:ABC-2 type transport system permease protein
MREMEFRGNFLISMGGDIVRFFGIILFFDIIYLHVDQIAGWTLYEVLFLIATNFLIDGLYQTFFSSSVGRISELINTGNLDFILLKPMDSQFVVSTQKVNPTGLSGILLALPVFFYSLSQLPVSLLSEPFRLLLYTALVFNSLLIKYSLALIFMTLSFWITRAEAIRALLMDFFRFSSYPAEIFNKETRFVLLFVIPVIVIANFPARIMIRTLTPWFIIYAFFAAGFLLFISRFFWKLALRYYSSASS